MYNRKKRTTFITIIFFNNNCCLLVLIITFHVICIFVFGKKNWKCIIEILYNSPSCPSQKGPVWDCLCHKGTIKAKSVKVSETYTVQIGALSTRPCHITYKMIHSLILKS